MLTYLAVQSVAQLGDAARDLVKVHRLATTVAFENVERHGGCCVLAVDLSSLSYRVLGWYLRALMVERLAGM